MVEGKEMEVANVENPKLQSNVNCLSGRTFHGSTEHCCDAKRFQCHGHWDHFAQTDHYSSSLALTSTLLEVIGVLYGVSSN